jgi:hypothetical protein
MLWVGLPEDSETPGTNSTGGSVTRYGRLLPNCLFEGEGLHAIKSVYILNEKLNIPDRIT